MATRTQSPGAVAASRTAERGGSATPQVAADAPWNPNREPLSPQQWDDPASYPAGEPTPGGFWSADQPETRPPLAFGILPPEPVARRPAVREYALAVPLPAAQAALPVYLGGRYPDGYRAVFDRVVRKDEPRWTFSPQYSSVWYPEGPPLGDNAAIDGATAAGQRAVQLLAERGLLTPDTTVATSTAGADGSWTVVLIRHHAGLPVYSKSNLTARLDRDGRLRYLLTHHRPLLAQAPYPTRSPEEAWHLLQAGRGRQLAIGVESPAVRDPGERFEVVRVDVAVVASEPFLPRQLVPPYYCFRDAQGATLYVPAVADPHIDWWS